MVRGNSIGRRNAYVQEVTDHELAHTQGLQIIRPLLSGASNSDFLHLIPVPVHVSLEEMEVLAMVL